MAALPNFEKGIDYWTSVDATVDGVLGGFGTGPLPRVEQLGSRLFLLSLFPHLQTFASPLSTPAILESRSDRFVALDVGAGVGRVTKEVLLPLVDDVVTIEPVKHFIETARRESRVWRFLNDPVSAGESSERGKLGNSGDGKRVWFIQGALNDLDPARPCEGKDTQSLGVYGGVGADSTFGERALEIQYDVLWCQWCLGECCLAHFATSALTIALRPPEQSRPGLLPQKSSASAQARLFCSGRHAGPGRLHPAPAHPRR